MNLDRELMRTNPDFVAFQPGTLDQSTACTGNEHFLVEQVAKDHLIAVWTQSSYEGNPDQHLVFARSYDGGVSWESPRTLAGPDLAAGVGMASWGFPVVSASGRLYVFFSRNADKADRAPALAGRLHCIVSEDGGDTWSTPVPLEVPRSIWDHGDTSYPPNCIVWQKPTRLACGRHFVGQTRWVTPAKTEESGVTSVVEFLRFENIDEDPAPADVRISWFMQNENALKANTHLEEPAIVPLPDGRLFCAMRSSDGHAYFSLSDETGEQWSAPEPLRYHDGGPVIPHGHSPCPLYQFDENRYLFFHHNHGVEFSHWRKEVRDASRRPICLARGDFRPDASQPIWFSEPWYFMDSGGVGLPRKGLSLYSSVTRAGDDVVLWYPDRKFFLLGKRIADWMLDPLEIPSLPVT